MRPDVLAEILAQQIDRHLKSLVGPVADRLAALEREGVTRETLVALVAVEVKACVLAELETKALQGPPGPPGADGAPGLNGKDGAPGLTYCGVYVRGKQYDTGEIVTAGGSAFHCNRLTTGAPGSSPDWTLMVKRGQDGKDTGGRT